MVESFCSASAISSDEYCVVIPGSDGIGHVNLGMDAVIEFVQILILSKDKRRASRCLLRGKETKDQIIIDEGSKLRLCGILMCSLILTNNQNSLASSYLHILLNWLQESICYTYEDICLPYGIDVLIQACKFDEIVYSLCLEFIKSFYNNSPIATVYDECVIFSNTTLRVLPHPTFSSVQRR